MQLSPEIYNQVLSLLKQADQSLVFSHTGTPLRLLVGNSNRDLRMRKIAQKLKIDKVISCSSGFMAADKIAPYMYVSSISLTDAFYTGNCKKKLAGSQLKLFD